MIDKSILESIRKRYPAGSRIVLDDMKDPEAPPVFTQGTVTAVDDIGSVLVDWDDGSTLPVILTGDCCQSIDSIHIIQTEEEAKTTLDFYGKTQPESDAVCPRCGERMPGATSSHALSRYAQIYVCDTCGKIEAEEMAGSVKPLPLMEWQRMKAHPIPL